jgi:hypothetical protein
MADASSATVANHTSRAASLPRISFVIPARNEERFIGRVLTRLQEVVASTFDHEVIVVDQCSTDRTAQIAEDFGAKVLSVNVSTISELRNQGASIATGKLLAFIDADVLLHPSWIARFPKVCERLRENNRPVVTGSTCGIPQQPSWIEKFWFEPRLSASRSYINSGHLVISRSFFDEIGGFDETLATGEDYDLCQRARSAGAEIIDDPALPVEHLGYPKTIQHFFRREVWHGSGDATSLARVLQSKVAMSAAAFLLLHLGLIIGLATGATQVSLGTVAAIFGLCLLSSWRAYRHSGMSTIFGNLALYYVYFAARATSLIRGVITPHTIRRLVRAKRIVG